MQDLEVLLDGHSVTALLETGVNYSVISGYFAAELKKVKIARGVPKIRTGGHLITPNGICTARVTVHKETYPVTFITLLSAHNSRHQLRGVSGARSGCATPFHFIALPRAPCSSPLCLEAKGGSGF